MKRFASFVSRIRPLIRPYSRPIGYSDVLSDVLSNIMASFLIVLVGGLLLTNSTYQFSLFTRLRNSFVGPVAAYERIANIRGVVLDDETTLILGERSFPGDVYDALGESIRVINEYAATVSERRVVIGVDYVLNSVEKDGELDLLAAVLGELEPNLLVVLGGALSQAGIETGYFRSDVFRDRLISRLRQARGDEYVDRHIFIGNLHILKGNAVSGFQELENTDIALGYFPVFDQSGVVYYSLPFMMFMLGEIVPPDGLGTNGFCISSQGYLRYDCDVDPWLRPAVGKTLSDFRNTPLRFNFFSANDLSEGPLSLFNYFPLTRLSAAFNTDGLGAKSLREAIDINAFPLMERGIEPAEKSKADYFLIYRTKSLGYIRDNVSDDVVVTPASGRDSFTNGIQTVSGAMTHMVALSNLLRGEYIREAPAWVERLLAVLLSLLCIGLGLRCEFRSLMLSGVCIAVGVIALGYILFLFNILFSCRLPLMLSLGIVIAIGGTRFLASTVEK
jgi:hypothetical protein